MSPGYALDGAPGVVVLPPLDPVQPGRSCRATERAGRVGRAAAGLRRRIPCIPRPKRSFASSVRPLPRLCCRARRCSKHERTQFGRVERRQTLFAGGAAQHGRYSCGDTCTYVRLNLLHWRIKFRHPISLQNTLTSMERERWRESERRRQAIESKVGKTMPLSERARSRTCCQTCCVPPYYLPSSSSILSFRFLSPPPAPSSFSFLCFASLPFFPPFCPPFSLSLPRAKRLLCGIKALVDL